MAIPRHIEAHLTAPHAPAPLDPSLIFTSCALWYHRRTNQNPDAPCKQDVTELVCLAIQVSTGRQIGRFRRLVRVLPQPSPSPQSISTTASAPRNGRPGNGGVGVGAPARTAAAVNPRQGSHNPISTALPLPELFGELQRWMVSLGLDPGPQDAGGFSERGNCRCVVCVFIELHITAQSGPIILVILCYSH